MRRGIYRVLCIVRCRLIAFALHRRRAVSTGEHISHLPHVSHTSNSLVGNGEPFLGWCKRLRNIALSGALSGCLIFAPITEAAPPSRFPPISDTPDRCDRGFVGNTIGQANAVSNSLLDLRQCIYRTKDLKGRVLSGGLLQDADFSGANLEEVVFSKAFAMGANFEGANLANAILDRADFSKANLKNANLTNSVITGANFNEANLENTNFEDALIGGEDVKRMCENPTLQGDSRAQIGCRR